VRSRLEDLEAELAEYETLRQDGPTEPVADFIVGTGTALIKARIVRQLTQAELGLRLAVAEQQVQRWEASHYRGVATLRLQQVADALKRRRPNRPGLDSARYSSKPKDSVTVRGAPTVRPNPSTALR
jgi:hypothetical protein